MTQPNRKIGIVGAGGFVGGSVARYLAGQGHTIVPLPRIAAEQIARFASRDDLPLAAEFDPYLAQLATCEAVVNCAGKTGRRADTNELELINEHLPELLYRLASTAGTKCFVHLSSVAALTSLTPPGRALGDDAEPVPRNAYGRSKLAADRRLLAAQNPLTRLIVLRPPILYGPGAGGVFALLARAAAMRLPLAIAGLGNKRSFLFVDNLADAVSASIGCAAVAGSYLITDWDPITPGEFYDALAMASGKPALSWRMPGALLKPVATLLLGSRADSLLGEAAYDSSRFREAAGWLPPFSFERAVELSMNRTQLAT